MGELGKGAGKGGGGGGSIREAGGAMGKKQAAEEEMYFKCVDLFDLFIYFCKLIGILVMPYPCHLYVNLYVLGSSATF